MQMWYNRSLYVKKMMKRLTQNANSSSSKCAKEGCRYTQLNRLPSAAPKLQDEDKLPICRDFHLRGNCSRESSCRFVHPDSNVQVVDNYVTVCRDYVRGHCKREQCRFYHPSDKHGIHSKNGDERRFDNGERNNDSMEAAEVASAE